MLEFEEALKIIAALARPSSSERISLEDADGRILSEDVVADRNYPPFNRAAMDGYAIRFSDWQQGIRKYRVVETILAGQTSHAEITSGSCYKIMTGAATPPSADVIIRREDARELDSEVELSAESLRKFQNISLEAEDAAKGSVLAKAPLRCEPQLISLLAATGYHEVSVYKLPSVSLVTTGDEVVPLPGPVNPVQIRNSNQYLLRSLLKKWQIVPQLCRHVADDPAALRETLDAAIKADITIINGGVSAGDADYVPAILRELGVREIFHKVAIRPGKPLWIGQTDDGRTVFALPGNPLSCLTTFTLFVETFFYHSLGFGGRPSYKIPLNQKRNKKSQLTEFFPVKLNAQASGLDILPFNGSGDITAGLLADGLAAHPKEESSIECGQLVDFYPFKSIF